MSKVSLNVTMSSQRRLYVANVIFRAKVQASSRVDWFSMDSAVQTTGAVTDLFHIMEYQNP